MPKLPANGLNLAVIDPPVSLINNRMGTVGIDREAFEVGFKGWDWSMGSIQDPWCAGCHPRGRAISLSVV